MAQSPNNINRKEKTFSPVYTRAVLQRTHTKAFAGKSHGCGTRSACEQTIRSRPFTNLIQSKAFMELFIKQTVIKLMASVIFTRAARKKSFAFDAFYLLALPLPANTPCPSRNRIPMLAFLPFSAKCISAHSLLKSWKIP